MSLGFVDCNLLQSSSLQQWWLPQNQSRNRQDNSIETSAMTCMPQHPKNCGQMSQGLKED